MQGCAHFLTALALCRACVRPVQSLPAMRAPAGLCCALLLVAYFLLSCYPHLSFRPVTVYSEASESAWPACAAGDCRAVLCRAGKALQLTEDHSAASPSERARVEARVWTGG